MLLCLRVNLTVVWVLTVILSRLVLVSVLGRQQLFNCFPENSYFYLHSLEVPKSLLALFLVCLDCLLMLLS